VCCVGLCADCIYEELTSHRDTHKDHRIIRVQDTLESTAQKLTEARGTIEANASGLRNLLSDLQAEIRRMNGERDQTLIEMHRTFRAVVERVKGPFAECEHEIQTAMDSLLALAGSAQRCISDAETMIKSEDSDATAPALIVIIGDIDQLKGKIDAFEPTAMSVPTVPNELVPSFQFFDMEIPEFASLTQKFLAAKPDDVRFVYSKRFRLYDVKWRMKIYPAGNSNGLNTHLSVFVELLEGVRDKVSIVYQLEMAGDAGKSFVRSYSSVFELMDSWGWNKLIPLPDVAAYLTESGSLRLKLGVRPESYIEAVKIARYKQRMIDARLEKLERDPAEPRRRSSRPHE
jgi:hypothetical protein